MPVTVHHDSITIGTVTISFQRTLRLPDDGAVHALPPGLGRFPLARVDDHADRVPADWLQHGGVFLPMHPREAMWISFSCRAWEPMAVKVAAGMVNAVTGDPWTDGLSRDRQDYLVAPHQPWLDGFKTASGEVRQFVAMPLGSGYTAEGQITGEERFGGLQIAAYAARPGAIRRPDVVLHERVGMGQAWDGLAVESLQAAPAAPMGMAPGGRMRQKVYPDPHGRATWREDHEGRVFVHIVDAMAYRQITGRAAPPSPISAQTYAQHGLPWFSLYDDHAGDVPGSGTLDSVRTVAQSDADRGIGPRPEDAPLHVPPGSVRPARDVRDGSW